MSKTVDERVVSMQFDNRHFETNVRTTMSTLDKLKASLNLKGASSGLDNISSSASKINLNPLSKGIETVTAKFSALQVMGVTALANITNSAVNAGKKIVSALTIDPIKTGFQEYETQINAVQTILANTESKGTTLQDVNRALDELNTYADKTIYNFTEMTRNIGTFTAAGVDLDTSVSAIQGIANLAAVSGSTSQQASTAMYQLSQALAAGKVSLMDWNSVVNADMGGQVFQDALKRTAENMGKDVDGLIEKYGSFRESLTQGEWLTTDVLTKTLEQFTMAAEEGTEQWEAYKKSLMDSGYSEEQAISILKMANTATDAATKVKTFTQLIDTLKESVQSGWTQSWEIIMGDFGEAKEFLTEVSNRLGEMIGASAEARNKMLSGGLSTGWKQLLNEGISDEERYKETLISVAKESGVALDEMIAKAEETGGTFEDALCDGLKSGKISSDMLTESVHKMSDKMSNMSAEELKAAGYTQEHVKQIKDLSDGLKKGEISMDDFVKKMTRSSGRENLIQALWNSFDGLLSIIKPVKEAFGEIFPPITGEQLYAFTEKLAELTEKFKISDETAAKLKATFKGVFSVIDIGVTFLKDLAGGVVKVLAGFDGFGNGLLDITASIGNWLSGLRDSVKSTDVFGKAVDKVAGVLQKFVSALGVAYTWVKQKLVMPGWEGFLDIMSKIWDIVTKVGSKVADVGSSIAKSFSNVFNTDNILSGLDIINGGLFAGILLGINKFINGGAFDGFKDIVDAISNPLESLKEKLAPVKGILDSVRGCLEAYQQNLKANVLLKLAGAIAILAASLVVIAMIDAEKLNSSVGAITMLFANLMGAMAAFSKISSFGDGSKGIAGFISSFKQLYELDRAAGIMIKVSASVLILAFAMKQIGGMNWGELAKGLVGVFGLMLMVVGSMAALSKVGGSATKGAGQMILIAAAMHIFADVAKKFGEMKWEGLAKAGVAIGGILLLSAMFEVLAGMSKKATSASIALVVIGAAMEIFADVTKKFGEAEWDELGKAGAAMGGILLMASVFAVLAGYSNKMLSSVISLTIIAAAMEIFADIANKFGTMKWEELVKAGSAIGGILLLAAGFSLIAGLSSGILTSAAALLVMSASLAILTPVLTKLGGLSWGEIGKGLFTVAAAFAIVGVAGAILAPLVPAIVGLAAAFVLIGVATMSVGAGLALAAAGLSALSVSAAAGATAIVAALTIITTGIINLIPAIVKSIGEAIVVFCDVIIQAAPKIGEAVKALVLTLTDVLVECIPQIAEAALELISGVLEALGTYAPRIVDGLFTFLIGVIDAVAARLPELIQAGVELLGALFQGIVDALSGIDSTGLINAIISVGFLSALVIALGAISGLIPGAMIGVLGMGAVIAELAIVIAAIGALAQIPGLEWLISEGGDFLQTLGTAIGQFVGGIVGGIAEGATSTLPQVGTNLSNFFTNAKPFIEGVKTVDESVMSGVKALAGAILAITGASILEAIASFVTGGSSIDTFATQLNTFGDAVIGFSNKVKGNIDEGAVTAAANAGKSIAQLYNALPKTGGWTQTMFGEQNIGTFSTQLTAFGTAITGFSNKVKGNIDEGAVTAAANAGATIAALYDKLPKSGGWMQEIFGEQNLDTFGQQLVAFGDAMVSFSSKVKGNINEEAVTAAANAGNTLVKLANALPKDGSVWDIFSSEDSMNFEDFGKQITAFGQAMVDFSDKVSGSVDAGAVGDSISAAKKLISLFKTMGGIDTENVDTFRDAVKSLGKAKVENFYESFTASKAENAASAVRKIVSLIKSMAGMDATGVGTFKKALKDLSTVEITSFVKAFSSAATKLAKAGTDMMNGFIKGISSGSPKAVNAIKNMVTKLISTVTTVQSKFDTAGKTLMTRLVRGLQQNASKARSVIKSAILQALSATTGAYSSFYANGKYLGSGLVAGINAKKTAAYNAGYALGAAAAQGEKDGQKSNSPSKLTIQNGKWLGEGLIIGINKMGKSVYNSGYKMGETATESISGAISKVVDILDSDMDAQPTIRPVVDLSDVTDKAGTIGSMFGLNPSVGLLTNVGNIGSMMNRSHSGNDIISAIAGLRSDLSARTGDTYNINGISYDDGSNVSDAVKTLVRAARIERRR